MALECGDHGILFCNFCQNCNVCMCSELGIIELSEICDFLLLFVLIFLFYFIIYMFFSIDLCGVGLEVGSF